MNFHGDSAGYFEMNTSCYRILLFHHRFIRRDYKSFYSSEVTANQTQFSEQSRLNSIAVLRKKIEPTNTIDSLALRIIDVRKEHDPKEKPANTVIRSPFGWPFQHVQ